MFCKTAILVMLVAAVSSLPEKAVNKRAANVTCKLNKHPSVTYFCDNKICGGLLPSGSVVRPECNPHYYSTSVNAFMRCIDGRWDYVAQCLPECGTIGSGTIYSKDPLPWHASIYRKKDSEYQQICEGSLVTPKAVVTAAHCFWDEKEQSSRPASLYAVALGNTRRPWNHPADDENEIQRSEVKEIHIPKFFRGQSTNFNDDIAVLELVDTIKLSSRVKPVCVNFDVVFEKHQLYEGSVGKVSGWGNPSPKSTDILKTASPSYLSVEVCLASVPAAFRDYITTDKICVRYANETLLCRGDGGGGISFPEVSAGVTRFYLRAVTSTGPVLEDDSCPFISTNTLLSRHEDFIKPLL